MSDDVINEAIRLYREARQLHLETRQLFQQARGLWADDQISSLSSVTDTAAQNRSKALRLLEQVVALGENDEALRRHEVYALTHRNLGLLRRSHLKAGKTGMTAYNEDVIAHLTTALRLGAKRDSAVCYVLGTAYMHAGKPKEAAEFLKESVELNGKNDWARVNLFMSYLKLGDKVGAREQYERLKESNLVRRLFPSQMLERQLERPVGQPDEAEQQELKNMVEKFRYAEG